VNDANDNSLWRWVLPALAPTVASPLVLFAGPLMLLYPVAALMYLAWLGGVYVKKTPNPRLSVVSFIFTFAAVNLGVWGAGCICIFSSYNLGSMH